MRPLFRISLATAALSVPMRLDGCGTGTLNTGPVSGNLHLSGSVFGGQQPIANASVRLLTVNTTTLGGTVSAIISGGTVSSAADGSFSITGDYSCTNATQVYIVAVGGNPGAGTNNASLLATALGSCSNLTPSTSITINELTTVAAAYALAPYEGSSWTNIGAGMGTNAGTVGLPNAFLTAALLASPTVPAGVTVPTAELNTLANILAACVNSTGPSSAECTQLFAATGNATNTFDAAFYIAKNPGMAAVTGLYSLSSSSGPFQPMLAAAPNDFTVAVKYNGTAPVAFNGPSGIAFDAAGNAVITQQTGNSVVAVSPLNGNMAASANLFGGGLNGPRGIAVDTNGYVWVANPGAHNAVKVSPYSTNVASFPASLPTAYTLSAGANPIAMAADLFGNGYTLSPADDQIFALKRDGTVQTTLAYPQFTGSGAFAFSGAQTMIEGSSTGQTCLYTFVSNPTTVSFANPSLTCVPAGSASSIAAVNYSSANNTAGYVGIGNSGVTGAPLFGVGSSSPSIYLSTTTASTPTALAFDGAGNGFIADNGAIFKYNSSGTALSPAAGFGSLNSPQGVAVDPSGNLWVTNAGDNSLSIFVGLAAPTVTPLAATLH